MFDGSTEDLPSYIPGYDEYLEEFGSHKAHELLHTTFASRKR